MSIQQIPLRDRLAALPAGNPAHPEYVPAVLRAMANLPVTAVLSDYPEDLERLAELVRYPMQHMAELTYQAVTIRVQDMRHQSVPVGEVLTILARPYVDIYGKHLERMVQK